ncbi:ABC transporter substrate-binding protein [Halomonas elongata]|uniref:ABC transporter substrate-binding protein n=1 Tax=Halomonas elongata TaxID=2746 RepID=UPI0038D436BF
MPLSMLSISCRRWWYVWLFSFGLSLSTHPALASPSTEATAVFDWTIAETLLSLDPGTVVMGSIGYFHDWTDDEYADADIINVGVQTFPNMELLNETSPHQILLAPRQAYMKGRLADIASITLVNSFPYSQRNEGDMWSVLKKFTLDVGNLVGRHDAAEQLVADAQSDLKDLKAELDSQLPLLVIQPVHEQYARVYGANSMFQAVLEQLDLRNAWEGKTNQWGYSLVSVSELFAIQDARLVVVESPLPVGIENRLEQSNIWRYLPVVQRGDFVVLPPSFWVMGSLPSARRFADALVPALKEQ